MLRVLVLTLEPSGSVWLRVNPASIRIPAFGAQKQRTSSARGPSGYLAKGTASSHGLGFRV